MEESTQVGGDPFPAVFGDFLGRERLGSFGSITRQQEGEQGPAGVLTGRSGVLSLGTGRGRLLVGAGCSQATQHCPSTGFSAIGLALRMVSGSHLFSQDRAHHLISTMSSAARWPHLLAVLLRTFLSWAWQQQGPGWGGRREPLGWTCSESSAGLQGGALETLPGV